LAQKPGLLCFALSGDLVAFGRERVIGCAAEKVDV
jgi:hypothetical protein